MAVRFKNNGDGTTADGAILAANPDEFQEALNYRRDGVSIKYIELEADLDLNYSVTWYYRMTDIFNVNGMESYGNEKTRTVVNGNGHSITNIYVYPNCAVFGAISGMHSTYSSTSQGILELNDITFEAILQKGAGFFSHTSRQTWPSKPGYVRYITPITNGCIFNVKVDNSMDNTGFEKLLPFDYREITRWQNQDVYPKAINCIFNIYIAAASNDNNHLFSVNANSATDFGIMTIFESCEFRIRNNTDKLVSIFKLISSDSGNKFLIDNCSIFLADIKQYDDPNQRTTHYDEDKMHKLGTWSPYGYAPSIGYPKCLFYNSFIAAFGDDFNSGSNDPIYIDGRQNDINRYIFATSFYDKSKIKFCDCGYGNITQEPTGFTALTTAQCKNKNALSDIGYLFAEEV